MSEQYTRVCKKCECETSNVDKCEECGFSASDSSMDLVNKIRDQYEDYLDICVGIGEMCEGEKEHALEMLDLVIYGNTLWD